MFSPYLFSFTMFFPLLIFLGLTVHEAQSTDQTFERLCVPIHFRAPRFSLLSELSDEVTALSDEKDEEDEELCLTQGKIKEIRKWGKFRKNFLLTEDSQTRAVLSNDQINSIGLCFSPVKSKNKKAEPTSLNIIGQQIGLKLKAQDSCNLLYVMWRSKPQNTIVISRKINNNRHTHKECLNDGYKTLASIPLDKEKWHEGEFHSIKAKIKNDLLVIYVDEREIWQGILDKDLQDLHGPMGIRTDNGTFIFQMDDWNNTQKNCPITQSVFTSTSSDSHLALNDDPSVVLPTSD